MKINDKVYLNKDSELRLFFYNDDTAFKDHENDHCKEGTKFTIVGYVPEKSNNIRTDEESGDFPNYAFVIKNLSNLELFRISRDVMETHFIKLELN